MLESLVITQIESLLHLVDRHAPRRFRHIGIDVAPVDAFDLCPLYATTPRLTSKSPASYIKARTS